MNVKLTLRMRKKVIEKAKKYARNSNQSLSSMVENYFELITDSSRSINIDLSPNVLELSGIIKLDEDFDYKEEYRKHLSEKYG